MCANRFASRWAAMLAVAMSSVIFAVAVSAISAEGKEVPAKPVAKTAAAYSTPAKTTKSASIPDGEELFAREWLSNDSRAHGGDGLGPVFNDSSCIACHNQGGAGGSGPTSKNVDIITAFPVQRAANQAALISEPETLPQSLFNATFGSLVPPEPAQTKTNGKSTHGPTPEQVKLANEQIKRELTRIHPAFATSRSVVLHHFGIDAKYEAWRARFATGQFVEDDVNVEQKVVIRGVGNVPPLVVATGGPGGIPATGLDTRRLIVEQNPEIVALQNSVRMKNAGQFGSTVQNGSVQISRSQRNPIALFGVGEIDAIPEQTIIDLAKLEHQQYPTVAGRPAMHKDGKTGRFGWKDQKASLEDFALTACAIELGLNVPGHEQAGVPLKPGYKAPGLDMNQAECDALVSYLRNLPAPTERKAATAQEAATISAGHKLFASTGCATCHVEKVGSVTGVYSDLLLHDMGPELGDEGDYDIFTTNVPEEAQDDAPAIAAKVAVSASGHAAGTAKPILGALRQEWRTAPLWGVRDSGPYLHDGRADTLEQAIAFHGGQASSAALKFFKLKPEERAQLIAFLKSLTAPDPTPTTVRLAAQ
jgi:CxxC motif-containing protein (DUF1111 family)